MSTEIQLLKLSDLETALSEITDLITVDADLQELVGYLRKIEDMEAACKQWKAEARNRLMEAMKAHGDGNKPAEIHMGTKRYYIGVEKKWKPVKVEGVLSAVLECGGVAALARCIAANGLKHAAVKTELDDDDQFNQLFVLEKKGKLEEGKAKKLKVVDDRFIKPKAIERSAD